MIEAVVALGAVAAVLAAALVLVLWGQLLERREWATERRALVDRAIAKHTGEVIALDRAPRVEHTEPRERPSAVGLS